MGLDKNHNVIKNQVLLCTYINTFIRDHYRIVISKFRSIRKSINKVNKILLFIYY